MLLNTLLTHTARNGCSAHPSRFTQSHSRWILSNTYSSLMESSWNCNNCSNTALWFGSNEDLKIIVQGQGIYLFIFKLMVQIRGSALIQLVTPWEKKHRPYTCHTAEGPLEGMYTLCAKHCSAREEGDIRNGSLKSQMTATESGPRFYVCTLASQQLNFFYAETCCRTCPTLFSKIQKQIQISPNETTHSLYKN